MAAFAFLVTSAQGATFTVSNNLDSGAGSLRQAIVDANAAPGVDTIDFSLAVPAIIAPASQLPAITDPVIIDGTTVTGYAGTPRIGLNGVIAGAGAVGLRINAGGSTVRGLAIYRFGQEGMQLSSQGGNVIDANFIFSNAQRGINVNCPSNIIGGIVGNLISINTRDGIRVVSANGNRIVGNIIGTDLTGTNAFGNGMAGIAVVNSTETTIGGTNTTDGNIIAFNSTSGVSISSGTNNAVLGNSISSNTVLGIDLGGDGVTANDTGDGDSGPNQRQNFPVLTSPTTGTNTVVLATLNSTANTAFRIEFFANSACDPSGFGEGEEFLDATNLTTDSGGDAVLLVNLTNAVPVGQFLTATATDPFGNTSEFSDCQTVATPASADLSITASDSPDPVTTTSNLTYSIAVTNNGSVAATGVTLIDTLPSGVTFVSATPTTGNCTIVGGIVTCNLGSLANGAGSTVAIVVQPSAAGTITNTASVFSTSSDSVAGNNSATETTTVVAPADLSLSKSDSPDPVDVLANLTYTLTITNGGPGPATSVTLVDNLPSNVGVGPISSSQGGFVQVGNALTFNLGTLTNGGVASATVVVIPGAAGVITNTANVTASEPDPSSANNSATATTTVNPLADLALTKTGSPGSLLAGANLTYTLNVTNRGPSTATSVAVTDSLPATVTFASVSPSQGGCNEAGGVVTCNLGTMASSDVATIAIVVTTTIDGTITNSASVTAAETDPVAGNNAAAANTAVNPVVDLALSKTDSPEPVFAGTNLTYTLSVNNLGPSTATSVTATDPLPASVAFVSAAPSQGSCTNVSGTVTCAFGSLASGAGATASVVVTPTLAGVITNTASVTVTEPDSNGGNNTASAQTTVSPSADLRVAQSDSPDPVFAGSNLTYAAVIVNDGPSAATSVTLTNTLPSTVTFTSATPSQGICNESGGIVTCNLGPLAVGSTGTVSIVVSPTTAGTITNSVTATAAEHDPDALNSRATVLTTVDPAADLSLAKTASPEPLYLGGTFSYTNRIINTGPSPATGTVLTDTLPAGVTFVSATMSSQVNCSEAGGVVTCTLSTLAKGATGTVRIAVIPNVTGTITNTASVTATEFDRNNGNNSASVTRLVSPSADVSVTKSDSPDPVLVGANLNYSLTIVNDGPSAASVVAATDTLPTTVTFVSANSSQGGCSEVGGVVTCNLGALASGATGTVAIVIVPTTVATITNTATVTAAEHDDDAANNLSRATTRVNPSADLSVAKSASANPVVGQSNLTYTITVTNHGPSTATSVALADTLPASVSFISVTTSQGSATESGSGVAWNIGTLINGGSAMATIIVDPHAEGALTNTASVTGAETDPAPANNDAAVVATVDPSANLFLLQSDLPDPVLTGSNLTYTVTLANSGPSTASAVTLTNTLPPGVTFVSATPSQGTCSDSGGVVTCDVGSLPNGATATVSIDVTTGSPGIITNGASVTAAEFDANASNNSASSLTTVGAPANGPDLVGRWDAAISTCKRRSGPRSRCLILGAFTVENHGNEQSPRSRVRFYRSTDGTLDGSDVLMKEIKLAHQKPGGTDFILFGAKLPRGTRGGGQFVIASIDPDDAVNEMSETNNQIVFGPLGETVR